MAKRKRNYDVICSCEVCGRRFRASRKDAKYDSAKCRKQAARARAGQALNVNMPDAAQMNLNFLDRLLDQLPYSIVACGYAS